MFSVLWRKTWIREIFNHGVSPRALRSVPMTTRGATSGADLGGLADGITGEVRPL